jgi:hypothetical protein
MQAPEVRPVLAIAGSVYLLSTVAFCLCCVVIGARLLLLSRRTGGVPERLLGLGLGLTGGLGYGVLIAVSLTRQALGEAAYPAFTVAGALGKLLHDLGVCAVLAFVVHVFRPGAAWARALVAAMIAAMALGYAGYTLAGGFAHGRPEGFWYWLEFAPIGTYQVWAAAEALLYYRMMLRRRALGLADPLVANRFLCWGVGSLLAVAAIWTVSVPALLGLPLGEQQRVAPFTLSLTAVWGIGCVAAYWLAFFPPRWYRAGLSSTAD